jgi:hypothetical protein
LAETKRSIANVVSHVLNQYKFTSLPELNAVLTLYHVTADQGGKESRTFKNHGLYYRLLDEKGNKIGVPIKASSIYFKPTLKYLEEKFTQNESLRLPYKSKLKTAIDWTLSKRPANMVDFVFELKKEKITTVIRQNEQGFIYGISFIDHRNKTVFNGSYLGKQYSAAGIRERISKGLSEAKVSQPNLLEKPINSVSHTREISQFKETKQDSDQQQSGQRSTKDNLLELLTGKERNDYRTPFDFIKKKKKRRKPKL